MHLKEGELSKLKSETERTMWRQVNGKVYGGIMMDKNKAMWNAEVVAIPKRT